ncbi:MAG: hypothetical protein J6T20_08270 [Treponema sp.]|nr:hypothetical protein [Treponema sp.]
MSPTAQKIADHYVELLSTLNYEMKLSIINSLSASLLDDVSRTASKKKIRSFGMAKGKLQYPDNIDFCNEEIAEMFGVNA